MLNPTQPADANRTVPRAEHAERDDCDDRDIVDRSTMSSTLPPLTKLGISAKPKLTSSLPGAYYYGRCHAGSKRSSFINVPKATVSVGAPPARPDPTVNQLSFEELQALYTSGKAPSGEPEHDSDGQSEDCTVPRAVKDLLLTTATHLELSDGSKIIKICQHKSIALALQSEEVKHALSASKIGVGPFVYGYGYKGSDKDPSIAYTYIIMEKIELSLAQYILNCTQAVVNAKERMGIYQYSNADMRNSRFARTGIAFLNLRFPADHTVVAKELQTNILKLWNGLEDGSFNGFMHLDLHTHNVMLRTSVHGEDKSTVVFIDYGDVLKSTPGLREQLAAKDGASSKVIDMGSSGNSTRTLKFAGTDDECALMIKAGLLNAGGDISDHIDGFFSALDDLKIPATLLLKKWKQETEPSDGQKEAVVAMFLGKTKSDNDTLLGGIHDEKSFRYWLEQRGWNVDKQAQTIPQMENAIVAIEKVYFGYGRGQTTNAEQEKGPPPEGLAFDQRYNMSYNPFSREDFTEQNRITRDERNNIVRELDERYIWTQTPARDD
jgi:hypothetical protein